MSTLTLINQIRETSRASGRILKNSINNSLIAEEEKNPSRLIFKYNNVNYIEFRIKIDYTCNQGRAEYKIAAD